MTHAEQRLKEAEKYVAKQWGPGWNRLGVNIREALLRAEILAEIARIPVKIVDPKDYLELVNELATQAMRWNGDII